MEIMGKEHADQLAKEGAMVERKPRGQLEIHKQINKIKHQIAAQQELNEEELLNDKLYQNIKNRTDLFNVPRKTAVALWKWVTTALLNIYAGSTAYLLLHASYVMKTPMNRHHVGECKSVTNSSLAALYWEARGKMIQIG